MPEPTETSESKDETTAEQPTSAPPPEPETLDALPVAEPEPEPEPAPAPHHPPAQQAAPIATQSHQPGRAPLPAPAGNVVAATPPVQGRCMGVSGALPIARGGGVSLPKKATR